MNVDTYIEYLKEVWPEYEGKWVAIKDGELLNHGDSYKELHDKFKHLKNVVIIKLIW